MSSTEPAKRQRAINALLKTTPDDVPSLETRKQIAKAFKRLAESPDTFGREKEQAIRGLVIWGGKYSGPILLGLLNTAHGSDQRHLIQALGEIKSCARRRGDSLQTRQPRLPRMRRSRL